MKTPTEEEIKKYCLNAKAKVEAKRAIDWYKKRLTELNPPISGEVREKLIEILGGDWLFEVDRERNSKTGERYPVMGIDTAALADALIQSGLLNTEGKEVKYPDESHGLLTGTVAEYAYNNGYNDAIEDMKTLNNPK